MGIEALTVSSVMLSFLTCADNVALSADMFLAESHRILIARSFVSCRSVPLKSAWILSSICGRMVFKMLLTFKFLEMWLSLPT